MSHAEKLQRLREQIQPSAGSAPIGLAKDTSNLFRDRKQAPRQKLDVRQFNEVLSINREERWVEVEGMTPYVKLVEAMLAQGLMPAVVPQLKSITIGGAAAGVGIEATSFRYGLVHETLQELEILLPDGRVVLVKPDNDYRDLFYGFPNSYGTLGYALKLRALAVPVKPFVAVRHTQFEDPEAFFGAIEAGCGGDADFVDGVVFGPNELVLSEARFVDEAPWTSDYTYQNIYYRSLRQRDSDYLTTSDYIWRWDTDWFWCSKNLGAQNRLIRRLLGRERLNSIFYTKMMRWNSKWGLTRHLDRLLGRHRESVIQDVDIPLRNAPAFLDFFQREIGILPIWICPIRPYRKDARFTLFPMDPDTLYLNFGFWDVVRRRQAFAPGHHNRLVENQVTELGGIKSLYSESCYALEDFWRIYDGQAYRVLKSKYDPQGRARDLYQKCVLRQ
ncbi:MAG: FAD-binding oxidoreductase [Thiobacillaceae bacterium]|jgi:FAD/FMN-containing dehydrogenase|nr:FAD-binding oxidoreductase [Thiobacillaceae bacterium]